jgi:hypothetical protein
MPRVVSEKNSIKNKKIPKLNFNLTVQKMCKGALNILNSQEFLFRCYHTK